MDVVYRKAVTDDLDGIANFTDFWIGGLGISCKVPGAGHDFFVPKGRHRDYLRKYAVLLAIYCGEIVGWAVKTNKGVLIHLLVAGTFRGQGIGRKMLDLLEPEVVRSKMDQSTGDPAKFYAKAGYISKSSERLGRKKNIELFIRADGVKSTADDNSFWVEDKIVVSAHKNSAISGKRQRTIDTIAEKIGLYNKERL